MTAASAPGLPTGFTADAPRRRNAWRHGTVYGYQEKGCRCDLCAEAKRRYYGHRPMAEYLAEVTKHGTENSAKRRCKCEECRAAAARARASRRARGTPPAVHNRNAYANGCRCDVCREAHRVYRLDQRKRARVAV